MKTPSLLLLVAAAVLPLMAVSCASTSPLPTPGTFQRSGAIALDVATSKSAYKVGETLTFTVRPSEDCHLAAWIIGADGVTTSLYPTAHDSGHIFRKGVTATIPGHGPFQFRVAPPAGREQLVVVASSVAIPSSTPVPAPGIWLKGVSVQSMSAPTAAIPTVTPRLGEARMVYEVLP